MIWVQRYEMLFENDILRFLVRTLLLRTLLLRTFLLINYLLAVDGYPYTNINRHLYKRRFIFEGIHQNASA